MQSVPTTLPTPPDSPNSDLIAPLLESDSSIDDQEDAMTYAHSDIAHNSFKKMRLQKTFDLIAQCLIIGFVGILVYYNWLMLVPHLTPLFWALLFAVLLYKPLNFIIGALHFIDEKIGPIKLKIYLSTAAVYIVFLLSSSLLTIVVVSCIFAVWSFLLFGERQSVGAVILLALLSVALGLPTYYIIVTCVQESTELATKIQHFVESNAEFQTLLDDFGSSPYYIWAVDYAKQWGVDLPAYDPQIIKDKIVEFSMQFTSQITNALGSIVGVLSSGVQVLVSFITFASSLYYFLVHLDTVTAILPEISPFSDEDSLVLVNSLHRSVTQIFLSSFLIFLAHIVGTWIIFTTTHVELTLVLSVLAGFTSMLPILGSYIIWIPVAIAKLATGQHLQALAITVVQLILQFPVDMLIYSIIPGNAFLVGFALAMGMYLFGFLGILVGPLLAGILITVINMYAVYQRLPRFKLKDSQIEIDLNKINQTLSFTNLAPSVMSTSVSNTTSTPLSRSFSSAMQQQQQQFFQRPQSASQQQQYKEQTQQLLQQQPHLFTSASSCSMNGNTDPNDVITASQKANNATLGAVPEELSNSNATVQ